MRKTNRTFLKLYAAAITLLAAGCANIVPPTGGDKDVTAPKLVSVTPADSQLNVRTTKIVLRFDEYITLKNPAEEIRLSPLLPIPLDITAGLKTITIKIPDTLLRANTTYHLTFGNAIQDLHENNPFSGYSYIFSTGSYFDSLSIKGQVLYAPTGMPDSSSLVLLFEKSAGDSALIRSHPLYATHTDAQGRFSFEGLPQEEFRIFALRDLDKNMNYGGGKEMAGFYNETIRPRPDSALILELRLFSEGRDTAAKVVSVARKGAGGSAVKESYHVLTDTSNLTARSQDINKPLSITFTAIPKEVNAGKIFLSYDSSGISVEAGIRTEPDSNKNLKINTDWRQNTVYELRLQKGFAKDSSGNDLLPGRYSFRTKREDDYAKLRIHLPTRYYGNDFVLEVISNTDTIYRQPVTDTIVSLTRLLPAGYSIYVIEDADHNGRYTTGNLLERKQPEVVHPYPSNPLQLKAGWDNVIDFITERKRRP